MAYIKVDHSKFEAAATAIDNYVRLMRSKMQSAQKEVDNLGSKWQGADYIQFKSQWQKDVGNGSVNEEMLKAMESYAKYLRYAANKYKEAQSKAVNRANGLPRW